MTRSFTEINTAIAWQLKESIGEDRFDAWFSNTDCIAIQDGQVVVMSTDDFSLSYIRQQFESALKDSVLSVLGPGTHIKFVTRDKPETTKTQHRLFTDEQLSCAKIPEAAIATANSDDSATAGLRKQRSNKTRIRNRDTRSNSLSNDASQNDSKQNDASRNNLPLFDGARNREKANDFASNKSSSQSLETFEFGPENLLLETAIKQMLSDPARFNPLVLHGPVGSGKSHLASAIVAKARKNGKYRRCVNVTSEQFTTSFIESLQHKTLTDFRNKFRNVDLLAIDDIQFLLGKQATVIEFQNTLETLMRSGKQVVITCDRPLFELDLAGDQLLTRMASGLACPISYPGREGRVQIVRSIAQQRDLTLTPAIQDLLVDRIGRDVRLLHGAMNRLQAATMAMRTTIDLDNANELMGDLFHATGTVVSLTKIEKVVCDICGVDAMELKSKKRIKRISTARMLAMWLSRKHTSAGLAEIGRYYGGRSHSTVVAAEKKINELLNSDASIDLKTRQSSLAAAVGRLENSLEVG